MTTRAQLESRLRAFKARLVGRQIVRSAFSGAAGLACGLGLGVILLQLLPRLLLGAEIGPWPALASAIAGFVAGILWESRRYRAPTLHEAALALEARLQSDTGALAAALRMTESDAFFNPVLARAEADLAAAERAPAPVLIRTRRLVLVPLLALASAVAFAAVINAEPAANTVRTAPQTAKAEGWSNIDVGGGRTEADRAAAREAMGLEEAAATLDHAAATLRDATTADETSRALREAKAALEKAGDHAVGISAEEVPETAPVDAGERASLADRLEAAARGLGDAASRLEKQGSGSEDSGKQGEFTAKGAREFVPMPAIQVQQVPARAIAVQTPARRELALRATLALEKLEK